MIAFAKTKPQLNITSMPLLWRSLQPNITVG